MALAADTGKDAAVRLDRWLAAGVLTVENGRYRFRHALLRQALLDGIAPHRRQALHRSVAQRLEQASAAPGLVGKHWLAAGDVDRAIAFSLAAAAEAFRLGAYEDVLRHADPLLAHRPRLPKALALKAEAMDALGRAGSLAAYDAAADVVKERERPVPAGPAPKRAGRRTAWPRRRCAPPAAGRPASPPAPNLPGTRRPDSRPG